MKIRRAVELGRALRRWRVGLSWRQFVKFLDRRMAVATSFMTMSAAIVNLSHAPHYVHWHFFQMSVPNDVVLGVMLLVFVLAVALPFPGGAHWRAARGQGSR